jgi:membrane dipeptidase
MLTADSHLDLAWSALDWNRDLKLPLAEIRRIELEGGPTKRNRPAGRNTVCLPAMRDANMCLSMATVLTWLNMPEDRKRGFNAPDLTYANGMAHVFYYRMLEAEGEVRMIGDLQTLNEHMAEWEAWDKAPAGKQPTLGFVLAAEGSDPIVGPWQVQQWWDLGLRVASAVHYGTGPYGFGHNMTGGLTPAGRELLKEFDRVGMILDITHLSDQGFWEAVDLFKGTLLASHHNCRALVPGPRQLSDEQIKLLIQRDAVIGVAFDDWMLYPNWPINPIQAGANEWVSLEDSVNHIDHICQLAGNARHVAIGSDLDGGFGNEETPRELENITDLHKLAEIMRRRGYREADVEAFMYGNWVRLLRKAWA